MTNKRRSERYRIELPVWLKDSHGGEHTVTADVSAHGIAVFTERTRTLRQYVELELRLPSSRIGVTAMVARSTDELQHHDGRRGRGIGLDFFLFDSRAKLEWQKFMSQARTEVENQNTEDRVEASPGAAPRIPSFDDHEETVGGDPEEPEEEGTPTFIIKPRDLGRLWAFFRGELSKGTVRIETPIAHAIGEPVELLVVHPSSQAEWTLTGEVARTDEHGRGGRPVLEIGLIGLDAEARTAFRNFVATGQGMIEEDVNFISELPTRAEMDTEERARSVVINLDAGGEEELVQPSAERVEEDPSERYGGNAFPRFPTGPVRDLSARSIPEAETETAPAAEDEDEAPLFEEWLEPTIGREDEPIRLPTSAITPANPLLDKVAIPDGPTEAAPTAAEVDAFNDDHEDGPESEETEYRDFDVSLQVSADPLPALQSEPKAPPPAPMSGRLFASFFFEAEAAKPKTLVPVTPKTAAAASSSASQLKATAPSAAAPRPAPINTKPIAARIEVKPPPLPKTPVPVAPPPIPKEPEVELPTDVPHAAEMEMELEPGLIIRGVPSPPPPVPSKEPAPAKNVAALRSVSRAPEKNPVTVEPWFERLGNEIQEQLSADTPMPPPRKQSMQAPAPPRRSAAARGFEESAKQSAHREVSTAGNDPSLDRDIALARARVVRSPNSVTACYRLSTLLMRRGEQDGYHEAIGTLQRVMDLEPNHPGAHHAAAEALARRGELDLAAEHLSRARRLGYRIDPELERTIAEGRKA